MAVRLWLHRLLRAAPLLATAAALLWVLSENPFARPLVARSATELRRALDRAVAGRVDAPWLNAELARALEAGDADRAPLLLQVAAEQVPPVAPDAALAEAADALAAETTAHAARDCLICMAEAGSCRSLTRIGLCLVPFELTPAGDLNALRQEAWAWLKGREVDELNAGLAIVGLGATASLVLTGGGSASAKAGATALRVARRIGALSPRFLGELSDLARLNLRPAGLWRYVRGQGPLDAALDTARLARLESLGADLTVVARNTSVAETLVLLRHVETAKDAARLARVSEAAGRDTRRYFEVLGKRRVFARLVRLGDLALTAAALIYGLALQLLTLAAGRLGRPATRGLARILRPGVR